MFKIRNVTRGPLAIDLGGRSIHLLPQAEETISDAEAGGAQVMALARGRHVRLTKIEEPAPVSSSRRKSVAVEGGEG